MKRLLLVAATALISGAATHAQAQDCTIENGLKVCMMPDPLVCDSIDNFANPKEFAASLGGRIYVNHGHVIGIVTPDDKRMVFSVDMLTREICLQVTATPLKQGTAL